MYSDIHVINKIMNHKIILHIATNGAKTLLDRHPIKCPMFLNRITYGHGYTLNDYNKNFIPHNTPHVNLRDEIGLRRPSRIIVMITGILIIILEFRIIYE